MAPQNTQNSTIFSLPKTTCPWNNARRKNQHCGKYRVYLLPTSTHYLPTAPSGSPTSVTVTSVTASSISIQWEEAACLQRNGRITGYIIIITRDGEAIQTVNVDSDARETSVYGLTPSTQYIVSVAAINGVGTGPSTDVTAQTESESIVLAIYYPLAYTLLYTRWTYTIG